MATLRDLGLSEYEARVYRTMLSTGPATAKDLSRGSDVPMGRIYDVLSGLEVAGMVRSQNAGRPKKYAPVEPETALDRLLEDRRQELETEIRQYEATVEELSDQLEATDPTDGKFWTVAVGPEDTVDLLAERLAATTDRIVMVADEPASGLDIGEVGERIVSELESALRRDVDVSLLVSGSLVDAIPPGLLEGYREAVLDHERFDLRLSEDVSGAFTILDSAEICIEVPHPLATDRAYALIDVTDPEFAATVREEFEPRWERASAYSVRD